MRVTRANVSRTNRLTRHGSKVLNGVLALALLLMTTALAAVGARPAPTGAQDGALETASLAPETTLFYAAVNLDLSSDQHALSNDLLERAGLSQFLASSADEVVSDDGADDFDPFLGGEAALIVTNLPSADALPIDEVAGALTGGAGASDSVAEMTEAATNDGFLLAVRPADVDEAWEKARELLDESAAESGNQVEALAYEGVEILTVAGTEDGLSDPAAIAQVGDFVLLAAAAEEIQAAIDVHDGRTPSLAESDTFSALRGELSDEWLGWAYVNGPGLKEGITTSATEADLAGLDFLLGDGQPALDAHTGIVVYASQAGFRLDTISIPSTDAEVPGGGNFDSGLVERVPSDTLLFLNGMDLGANPLLKAAALAFAQAINGGEPGAVPEGVSLDEYASEQFEEAASLLGFNLDTDLVSQLSGEFAVALSVTNLLSPDGISGVIVSGVTDPVAVADAVAKIALIVASGVGETATVSTRDIDGDTVNVYEDSASGFPLRVEYGVIGDQLIIGLGNGLDLMVNGPETSLADSENYQAAMGELPAEHGATAYIDLAQVITFAQLFLGATGGGEEFEDASPDCANYASQAEAQTAYDEDPGSLIDLDQDFDGEACEDFFAADGEATPAGPPDLSKIRALASVQFERDGLSGTSAILYIAE